MNDMQDLKQLVENLKTNINNDNEKYNKNFSYNNNGNLISIILKRFMKENITKEIESQIINNNIKAEKEIKKIDKIHNFVMFTFFISFIPTLFFILFIISRITTTIVFPNENIMTLFILSFLVTFSSLCYSFFLSYKKFKIEAQNKKNISEKALLNYNNKILKIILSITKDLNLIKSIESAEYIDRINKKLIDDAYLFENGKVDNFIGGSLKNAVLEKFLSIKNKQKKAIEDKMIKKEDFFEDISLEEKVNFLEKKII